MKLIRLGLALLLIAAQPALAAPPFQVTPASGSPAGQVPATTANDDAAAGKVGEVATSTPIAAGSAVSLGSAVTTNIASLPLTAGDWDVYIGFGVTGPVSTSVTKCAATISTANNTLTNTPGSQWQMVWPGGATLFNVQDIMGEVGPFRVSINATTTYYYNVNCSFTVSTAAAYGKIYARRPR